MRQYRQNNNNINAGTLMPYSTVGIGSIISTINMHEIAIIGMFENLGYLILLIISKDTIMLNINAIQLLYNPLRQYVAITKEIPGIGKPINPLMFIWSAITLYRVNLKTPQTAINKLTSITMDCNAIDAVLIDV